MIGWCYTVFIGSWRERLNWFKQDILIPNSRSYGKRSCSKKQQTFYVTCLHNRTVHRICKVQTWSRVSVRKKKLEEEEAELKRKHTDAAYQGISFTLNLYSGRKTSLQCNVSLMLHERHASFCLADAIKRNLQSLGLSAVYILQHSASAQ